MPWRTITRHPRAVHKLCNSNNCCSSTAGAQRTAGLHKHLVNDILAVRLNLPTLGVGALAKQLVASLLAGPSYAPGACPESLSSSRLLICWQRRLGWPGPSRKGPSSCAWWGRLWLPGLPLLRETCRTGACIEVLAGGRAPAALASPAWCTLLVCCVV
jgi:hypothetical protein